ncbi:MAG: GNAT family N-acetyltransferase [Cyanobacteria bacterium P01_A01_bin.15]
MATQGTRMGNDSGLSNIHTLSIVVNVTVLRVFMSMDATAQRTIALRAYCDEDFPAVCAIHDRARLFEVQDVYDLKTLMRLIGEEGDFENFHHSEKFVACLGETIVGFVGVDESLVSWLQVDPAYFGQGIGRELLQLGLELTGPQAWTVVFAGNTWARQLYESAGFVHTFDVTSAGSTLIYLKQSLHQHSLCLGAEQVKYSRAA